jgi:hypothetical protein
MKPLKFVGNSLNDLKSFPKPVQKEAGYQLNKRPKRPHWYFVDSAAVEIVIPAVGIGLKK